MIVLAKPKQTQMAHLPAIETNEEVKKEVTHM